MAKIARCAALFCGLFFSFLCGAAEAAQGMDLSKKIFLAAVLVVGIGIAAVKILIKRGGAEKGVSGFEDASPKTEAPAAARLKPAKLVGLHENREYKIPLEGGLTLGRVFDNDVVIKNPTVSRYHARIVAEEDGYVLYDLGSKKGTFLNGDMVDRKLLRNSDMIEIAREDFMFSYE